MTSRTAASATGALNAALCVWRVRRADASFSLFETLLCLTKVGHTMLDPLTMTPHDDEHSGDEDRWVSLGRSDHGRLLVVVHTFSATGSNTALVRVDSARLPTKREREQYERQP